MSLQSKWFGFGLDERYDDGVRAFEQGRYEEAVESLGHCLQSCKDARTVRLARYFLGESLARLGRAALDKGDPELAVGYFQSCLATHPTYADVHLHLSRAFGKLGETSLQHQHLSKALELNPHYGEAVLERGVVLYSEGRQQEALDSLIAAFPEADGLQKAVDRHQKGDQAEALHILQTLPLSSGYQANVHAKLADQHARSGDLPAALSEYEKALELQPEYPDVLCRYGQALLDADRVEDALHHFERACEINPSYTEAHAQRGIALKRLKRADEARAAFARTLELDPQHVIASLEARRR